MTKTTEHLGKGSDTPVGVAILGQGTVGREVLRILLANKDSLEHRVGGKLEVKGVAVGDISKPRPGVDPDLLTDDAMELIN